MTVLYATIAATFFGFADFFGGLASRKGSSWRVTAITQIVGLPVLALAMGAFALTAPEALGTGGWQPVLAGGVAGLSGGIGVLALFSALATGRMSVVAPMTAALAGSLPAVCDLLRGVRIGTPSLVAIALAVVAILVVSMTPDENEAAGDTRLAMGLALVAGAGFAGSYIAYSFAPADSGIWPIVGSRVTASVMLSLLAVLRTRGLSLERPAARVAISAGLLDVTANIALVNAIQRGPLSVASVLTSLYPVVTVMLAHLVLRERLRVMQWVGIVLALGAVVAASL